MCKLIMTNEIFQRCQVVNKQQGVLQDIVSAFLMENQFVSEHS